MAKVTPSGATITDVAERAGVSIATVSRVINQTATVAPETQAQVQAAINELNYRPRAAARVLASRRTKTLGLLLPEISGDFFPPLLRGIEAGARQNSYNLLIYSAPEGSGTGDPAAYPLGEHNTDGLLIFTDILPDEELVRLNRIGFPLVLIHRSAPAGLDTPCVTVENKSGARKLIDHLIETHGYRRIAMLTGPAGNEDSHWREIGYQESLAAHNIPFDPALVGCGSFDEPAAGAAVEAWLQEGLQIEAIFAGDDESAVGVIKALRQAGKRVPEDIAVVGFDDTIRSRYLNPPLTTVRAPIEQVGQAAVQRLLGLIRGEPGDSLLLFPTELVIRRSCGCC